MSPREAQSDAADERLTTLPAAPRLTIAQVVASLARSLDGAEGDIAEAGRRILATPDADEDMGAYAAARGRREGYARALALLGLTDEGRAHVAAEERRRGGR